MASQINNLGTTAIFIFFITLFMGAIFYLSEDISDKNDKLDLQSQTLMANLGQKYKDDYNETTYFGTPESNLTINSTFEGVDPYARQYLEDKSEINQKKGTVEKIILFPALLLLIFGVESYILLITFSSVVYGLLGFFIGLQIYKAIRTGEVD